MKCIIFTCLAALFAGGFSSLHAQATFQEKYFRDGMYFFDDLEKISQDELFTTYKEEFGLGEFDEMIPTNNVVKEDGVFNTKYVHYHNGVRVEGALMNVRGEKGIALATNGAVITGLDEDTDNIITKEEAVEAAIDYVGADLYPWQDSAREAAFKESTGNPDTSSYPRLC